MKTFRAWIDHRGANEDYVHESCARSLTRCRHARMLDLETDSYRILVRLIWRRWPPYFHVIPFFRAHRGTTVFRVGRP